MQNRKEKEEIVNLGGNGRFLYSYYTQKMITSNFFLPSTVS